MSNSKLVTIEKDAQKLRIHVDALAQHIKLGWRQIEDDVEAIVEAAEGDGDGGDGEVPAPIKSPKVKAAKAKPE